jgi:hypothetical protein
MCKVIKGSRDFWRREHSVCAFGRLATNGCAWSAKHEHTLMPGLCHLKNSILAYLTCSLGLLCAIFECTLTTKFMNISDKELYRKCKEYGSNALLWRRKFTGLLPEVSRRGLFQKKGFCSIFEFAARLAGISKKQVCAVLNLDSKLENYPKLRSLLVDGKVSSNKLTRVVSVLDHESEDFWVDKVKTLSSRALEAFVRDYKMEAGGDGFAVAGYEPCDSSSQLAMAGGSVNSAMADGSPGSGVQEMSSATALFENQNGFPQTGNSPKCLHVQTFGTKVESTFHPSGLKLSEEVQDKLLKLQQKGVDVNAMLTEMLGKREAEIEKEKEALAATEEEKTIAGVKATRHIPVKIDRIVKREHGEICSIPKCRQRYKVIHHTQRFSLARNHNPFYLAPLCKGHHEIAHSIDQKYRERRLA